MISQKLMLLCLVLSVLYIKTSYAEKVQISKSIYAGKNTNIIREVCENKYNDQDIRILQRLASNGDYYALIKLGIFYDIKSMQMYKQVEENNPASVAALLKTRNYPCNDIIHNKYYH